MPRVRQSPDGLCCCGCRRPCAEGSGYASPQCRRRVAESAYHERNRDAVNARARARRAKARGEAPPAPRPTRTYAPREAGPTETRAEVEALFAAQDQAHDGGAVEYLVWSSSASWVDEG